MFGKTPMSGDVMAASNLLNTQIQTAGFEYSMYIQPSFFVENNRRLAPASPG
jgi:hypothetical protein